MLLEGDFILELFQADPSPPQLFQAVWEIPWGSSHSVAA